MGRRNHQADTGEKVGGVEAVVEHQPLGAGVADEGGVAEILGVGQLREGLPQQGLPPLDQGGEAALRRGLGGGGDSARPGARAPAGGGHGEKAEGDRQQQAQGEQGQGSPAEAAAAPLPAAAAAVGGGRGEGGSVGHGDLPPDQTFRD